MSIRQIIELLKNKCTRQSSLKDIETLILPNNKLNWCWNIISQYINIQEVINNPNKPWNKQRLSMNRTLTVKDMDTLLLPNSVDDWDWNYISQYIDIQEVINNPNKPWIRDILKHNVGITDKILEFFDAGLLRHLQMNIPQLRYHTDIVIKYEY